MQMIHRSIWLSVLQQMVNQDTRIELCSKDIERRMTTNKLKLNNDKTELLVLNASHLLAPMLNSTYTGTELITASNIGIWFDNLISMDKQINSIWKPAFLSYTQYNQDTKFIPFKHCEILIHAFITSKLVYCNSLCQAFRETRFRGCRTSRIQPRGSSLELGSMIISRLYFKNYTGYQWPRE